MGFTPSNEKKEPQITNIGGFQESSTARIASNLVFGQILADPKILANDGYWNFLKTSTDRAFSALANGKEPSYADAGVVNGLKRVARLSDSSVPVQALIGGLAD